MAGIYIHIPFCRRKCAYCDFYSNSSTYYTEVTDALCHELERRKDYLQGEKIKNLYWGGGTPSVLPPDLHARVFRSIQQHYDLSQCEEITLEANPNDLTTSYLSELQAALPINRISMGIQSFHEKELQLLNRQHTVDQAIEAVEHCRSIGLSNISIDLMYGLPVQTLSDWQISIKKAIALQVPHISAYHLSIEQGTPFYLKRQKGLLHLPDEETSVSMYRLLIEELKKAGYEHYEISNFAFPGYHSRHNSSYWQGIPYLGVGPSAHSYNGQSRQWNISNLFRWIDTVYQRADHTEVEVLSTEMRYNEFIMTGLRTARGISPEEVRSLFGESYHTHLMQKADKYIHRNVLTETTAHRWRLSEEAIFISDSIICDLMI